MTCIANITPEGRRAAGSTARLALIALFMLGTFAVSANAQGHREDNRRDYHHDDNRHWNGGYYPAPPVVYGAPYYAPPPVVYGPGIGVVLPGVVIGIQ